VHEQSVGSDQADRVLDDLQRIRSSAGVGDTQTSLLFSSLTTP
jgi:hypothetical protein